MKSEKIKTKAYQTESKKTLITKLSNFINKSYLNYRHLTLETLHAGLTRSTTHMQGPIDLFLY